ncbi:MAG: riboflavin biosynthesis protein RibF [Omnitrophica WOR_2 bacterium RIFCSPLOWO2_02_FULL_45_28]|nr:MAG: riboflavin biosynthesis protein RibF [Omnitrophica WOR_2 bacterium RIFCSPLOWO2_02_FULL_45_28]
MKTIFGLSNLKEKFKDTIVMIGVFDGMHRGHRYLIERAVRAARALHKKTVAITFDPHPKGQPYLISLAHRLKVIAELGVSACLVIRFSQQFAKSPPESFIRDTLVKFFHPLYVFVGDNFRFGYRAQGDVALLKRLGKLLGFQVRPVRELGAGRKKISSQRIRSLIRAGSLKKAEELLGRRVSVLGTVIKGESRGRILGYRTANIDPHHEVLPKPGVYAVKVLYNEKEYNGICNIGRRPTFNSQEEPLNIEVHLFNFRKDIYAEDMEIKFIRKLRDEKKFPSPSFLSIQLKEDSRNALRLLNLKRVG